MVAGVTLIMDQVHKLWMLEVYGIAAKGRVSVLPFLDLVYVKNVGISYGLFPVDSARGQWFLAVFAAIVAIAMMIWLARSGTGRLMAWSLGFIAGGAIGNSIDRIRIGGVADFFSLHAFGYYWYVFNIADAAIVAGVIGLLYDSFILSRNDAAKDG